MTAAVPIIMASVVKIDLNLLALIASTAVPIDSGQALAEPIT